MGTGITPQWTVLLWGQLNKVDVMWISTKHLQNNFKNTRYCGLNRDRVFGNELTKDDWSKTQESEIHLRGSRGSGQGRRWENVKIRVWRGGGAEWVASARSRVGEWDAGRGSGGGGIQETVLMTISSFLGKEIFLQISSWVSPCSAMLRENPC